ncbi:hypothetical protein GOODEAATRI_032347 [Goodea atripinnis]|uniref:Uncharacterized protein n=1 Tax=Goodea atripinnis TaxID=208336 RepID=A0ABV0MML3_9TELE
MVAPGHNHHDFFASLWRNLGPTFCAELFQFNHILSFKHFSNMNGQTFFFRMFWYKIEFVVPSNTARCPSTEAVKQPQTITLPLACLAVGMMFFFCNAGLVLCQI